MFEPDSSSVLSDFDQKIEAKFGVLGLQKINLAANIRLNRYPV